ncbi:ras-related protein Rab-28 [Augochlora pura]
MSDVEEEVVSKGLKIVLIGDSGSGKTSIAQKFCHNEFTRQYTPTSGIDFFLKNLSIGYYRNVNLHLWDVGGLALHGNMLDKYVFGAHIILLVYDVTNTFSFEILEDWIEKIRKMNNSFEETPLMAMVGNKCDMEHQRSVKRDRSHKFAADNGFPSHDVSARTGEAILGVRLTKTDQDYYKPIIIAEIGDTVDMHTIQKVVKRIPTKKQSHIPFHPHLSKSAVCVLQ